MAALRILVAEDSQLHRRIIAALLKPFGECDFSSDGEDAVHKFQSALRENKPYGLICMDIIMPNMEGTEALRVIRSIEAENQIPPEKRVRIVMTTAQNDSASVMEAMRSHCDGYLLKPIQKDKLYPKLKQLGLEPPPPPLPPQPVAAPAAAAGAAAKQPDPSTAR